MIYNVWQIHPKKLGEVKKSKWKNICLVLLIYDVAYTIKDGCYYNEKYSQMRELTSSFKS